MSLNVRRVWSILTTDQLRLSLVPESQSRFLHGGCRPRLASLFRFALGRCRILLEKSNIGCAREKYVDAFWQPFESRVPQGCEQVVQDRLCCVEVLLRVCSAVSAISTLATSALTAENRGSSKTTMSLEADLQRTSPKRRDLTQMRIAGMSAIASAFGGVSGPDADIAKSTRLMLWTAPPLRHRSALGWVVASGRGCFMREERQSRRSAEAADALWASLRA